MAQTGKNKSAEYRTGRVKRRSGKEFKPDWAMAGESQKCDRPT